MSARALSAADLDGCGAERWDKMREVERTSGVGGLPGCEHLNQVLFRRARLLAFSQPGEDTILLQQRLACSPLDLHHLLLLNFPLRRDYIEV